MPENVEGKGGQPGMAEWPADKVERRTIDSLIPYARNSRQHSELQVAQIAASIREWGWTTPVLVDEHNTIIAGHGRIMAAHKLGIVEIPVMVARGWSEAQKRAYVIADNKIALNAGWDMEALKLELHGLSEMGFKMELVGFAPDELSMSMFDPPAATPPQPPSEGNYAEQYGVIAICRDAAHQEDVYNRLMALGLECRVVST